MTYKANILIAIYATIAFSLSACNKSLVNTLSTQSPNNMIITSSLDGRENSKIDTLHTLYQGSQNARPIKSNGFVKFEAKPGSTINIEMIKILKSRDFTDRYVPLVDSIDKDQIEQLLKLSENTFQIVPKSLETLYYSKRVLKSPIFHNDRIYVEAKAGNETFKGYFIKKRRLSWSGITSPILYQILGSAKEFDIENLAPSLASGIRLQTGNLYFSLNGIISVFQEKDSDKHSLSLGPILDINGVLQIGAPYHFKSEKFLLALGIRADFLAKLLPNTGTE